MPRLRLVVDELGGASISGVASTDGVALFRGSIDAAIDAMKAGAVGEEAVLVATINVDHVVELEANERFEAFYARADIVVVDGAPIVALARVLGARGLSRITGADLLPALIAQVAQTSGRVVIVGGRDTVRDEAVAAFRAQYPGIDLAGISFPLISSPDDERSRDVIDEIRATQPQFVFVSLGSPKQELWLSRWASELPAGVYVGVGAAVDFAAGTSRRAPRWIQTVGAEWLWRLAQEPRRLAGRYLGRGPRFLGFAARSVFRRG